MLLRFASDPGQIFLMEVNDDSDIVIKKWPDIKSRIGPIYNKLAYRRLKWDRPDGTKEAFEQFLNQVIDAPYE